MADAGSIQNALDGTDGSKVLPWRVVHLLRDAAIGDLSTQTDGDAENGEHQRVVVRPSGHAVQDPDAPL